MINVAKLCVAILEAKVGSLIGEEAIKELKSPVIEANLQKEISEAVKRAEKRFISDYSDREVCQVIMSMPLADLPSVKSSIRRFYDSPADPVVIDTFKNQFQNILSREIAPRRLEAAVTAFMEYLRLELINIESLREKILALVDIETSHNTGQTVHELREIKQLLTSISTTLPIHESKDRLVSKRSRILYVDDEPYYIEAQLTALQEMGFEIILATNFVEARSHLESSEPIDLIITDLMMPESKEKAGNEPYYGGLRVIEFARRIRVDIPIICLTIVASSDIIRELELLQVDAIYVKPFLPSELIEAVNSMLAHSKHSSRREMIRQEISRRKLELRNSNTEARIKAIWALAELYRHDITILEILKNTSENDKSVNVRKAANKAIQKLKSV